MRAKAASRSGMAARCACLIQAAAELLESVGAANLSLRGIAERAGLSRQAPYTHFADKEPLLATLVVTGFDRLASQVDAASAHLSGHEALAKAGEAYIAFAQDAPALFRLMFSRELVDKAKFPDAAAPEPGRLALWPPLSQPSSRQTIQRRLAWQRGASFTVTCRRLHT